MTNKEKFINILIDRLERRKNNKRKKVEEADYYEDIEQENEERLDLKELMQ
jgi:hypothetical protein